MNKEKILFMGINNKKTLILLGMEQGFRVINFVTMEQILKRKFSGGIGPIDCLETSNILALTGGGLFPSFPQNKVIIWDENSEQIKAEISLKQEIRNIKFKYEYLFIVTDNKIYVYSFFENLTLKMIRNTIYNPKGIFETNSIDQPCYFAYLTSENIVKKEQKNGIIHIFNLTDNLYSIISAHTSPIQCMKFNYKGNFFATASEKGTLIRIFETGKTVACRELRRGLETTKIYSLDFDFFDSWLICISKTGTLHAWALKLNKKG